MYGNSRISLRIMPLEDKHAEELVRRCAEDPETTSWMFDSQPAWAPLTTAQLRDKIAEELKKPHTAVFALLSGEDFVGIGEWSASWDTWSPYAWFIIWPEHRRKGLGREAARMLLEKTFLENPGHSISTATADWNEPALRFLRSMGFRDIGRMRRTHMKGGEYRDTLFFDILRSEYMTKGKGVRR